MGDVRSCVMMFQLRKSISALLVFVWRILRVPTNTERRMGDVFGNSCLVEGIKALGCSSSFSRVDMVTDLIPRIAMKYFHPYNEVFTKTQFSCFITWVLLL